jgi:hypothetical protein
VALMSPLSMTPPGLARPTLQHDAGYTLGFPIHVALELRVDRDGAEVSIPHFDFLSTAGLVGVTLTDPSGVVVFDHRPPVHRDPEEGASPLWLASGQPRRTLVDLSEVVPSTLPPGDYRAEVGFLSSRPPVWSDPFTLTLRAPTHGEQAVLDALSDQCSADETWGDWACRRPPDDFQWPTPQKPDDPLRFLRVVRELLVGPRELAEWTRQDLAALEGVCAPEREALWAEILHAQGDRAQAQAQSSTVVQQWPGLREWMTAVGSDAGPIASLRAALAALEQSDP